MHHGSVERTFETQTEVMILPNQHSGWLKTHLPGISEGQRPSDPFKNKTNASTWLIIVKPRVKTCVFKGQLLCCKAKVSQTSDSLCLFNRKLANHKNNEGAVFPVCVAASRHCKRRCFMLQANVNFFTRGLCTICKHLSGNMSGSLLLILGKIFRADGRSCFILIWWSWGCRKSPRCRFSLQGNWVHIHLA